MRKAIEIIVLVISFFKLTILGNNAIEDFVLKAYAYDYELGKIFHALGFVVLYVGIIALIIAFILIYFTLEYYLGEKEDDQED